MRLSHRRLSFSALALAATLCGCVHHQQMIVPVPDVPRELDKVILPPYKIQPPDILYVEVLMPPLDPAKQPYVTSVPPQPIQGQFLVGPDGTVMLGIYGSVNVAGLTKDQARERIREFISGVANIKANSLAVTVDVAAYNSSVYYVITDGAGNGVTVTPFPTTGSETVLDALGRIGGIPPVGSKKCIWIARRNPHGGPEQILPVDWCATAEHGVTQTNYQVLPGDRLFVQSQRLIAVDNMIAKILAPVEKIFGIILLGGSTVNELRNRGGNAGNGG